MLRIAKPTTQERDKLDTDPTVWDVVMEVQERSVPKDLELTKRAVDHWRHGRDQAIFGYVDFGTLQKKDILSVLAAVRQGNARISKNRFGHISTYKVVA